MNKFQRVTLRIVVAVGIVLLAASLRLWPLQALGLRLAYLTFYPAVMIAALYGGIFAGLLATVLSSLVVYFWHPAGQSFIQDSADWLGMAVFIINGIMVSLVCEFMLRVRIRMTDALAQANRFSDALNQISAFIYMKDCQGRYVYANRPTLELFKCSAEELVGSRDARFFSPDAVARLKAIDTRVLEYGEETAEEVVDGQRIYREIKTPIYEDPNKVRIWGLCGISTDITERKQLESLAKHYEAIIQFSEDAIISKSLDGIVTSWNPGAEAMFGYSADEMIGKSMQILFPRDRQHEEDAILERLQQGEKVESFETVRLRKDGTEINVSATISPIRGSSGEIIGASKIARDITERKQQEAALQESEARFRSTFDAAAIGMALVSLEGRFIQVNNALCHILGYTEAELTQKTFQDIAYSEDLENDLALIGELLADTRQSYQIEKRYVQKDGRVIWILLSGSVVRDSTGQVLYFIAQIQDINEHKILLDRLERQAQQDYLTGLYNRRFFLEQGDMELARAQRYGKELSLFMLDIDHFKAINDTYGHATGDIALLKLSHILRETLRSVDIIGRWGGEEFAILLPETDAQEATEIAERLRETIDLTKITLATGLPLHFTVSIGIATLKEKNTNIDILLNNADEALYQAKETGRNKVYLAD